MKNTRFRINQQYWWTNANYGEVKNDEKITEDNMTVELEKRSNRNDARSHVRVEQKDYRDCARLFQLPLESVRAYFNYYQFQSLHDDGPTANHLRLRNIDPKVAEHIYGTGKKTIVIVLAYFSCFLLMCLPIPTTASSSHCTMTGSWRDTTGC